MRDEAGAGWDGLRGGCGLEVCGCGGERTKFLKLLRVRGEAVLNFAGAGRERTQSFKPRRTLVSTANGL